MKDSVNQPLQTAADFWTRNGPADLARLALDYVFLGYPEMNIGRDQNGQVYAVTIWREICIPIGYLPESVYRVRWKRRESFNPMVFPVLRPV
jgi:hypothetical protein